MAISFLVPNPNTVEIPSTDMNEVQELNFIKTSEPFNGVLRVFGQMELNKKGKFTSGTVDVGGLHWQPEQACSVNPSGVITIGSQTIEPCVLESGLKICQKLDSCWEALAEYRDGIRDEAGVKVLWDLVIRQIQKASAVSLFEALLLANLHEHLEMEMSGTVAQPDYSLMSEEVRLQFDLIRKACPGMLHAVTKVGKRCLAFNDSVESQDCTINNLNIVEFLDKLICCASEGDSGNLAQLISVGFQSTEGASPVFILSGKLMPLVLKAYSLQSPLNGMMLFERNQYNTGAAVIMVYSYMGIPIMPLHEANAWDKYYGKDLLFAALTTTGNLNFGTSYASVPGLSGEEVAWRLYQDPNPLVKETVIHSVVLTAVKINDPKAVVWDAALLERN
jgi:hypothetical protein